MLRFDLPLVLLACEPVCFLTIKKVQFSEINIKEMIINTLTHKHMHSLKKNLLNIVKKKQTSYDRKFNLRVKESLFVEIMIKWVQKYNFTR